MPTCVDAILDQRQSRARHHGVSSLESGHTTRRGPRPYSFRTPGTKRFPCPEPPIGTPRRSTLTTIRPIWFLCVLLTACWALPAGAAGVSCHCFRDRSFDAASPAAVDPYVLATTQNSLLAATFGIPKKAVVQAKMTGADGGRLWVSQFLARSSGRSAEALLEARGKAVSWADALKQAQVEMPAALTPASQSDAALAAAVVDQVLATRLGASAEVLGSLRAAGASDAEVIAATYLGLRAGKPSVALLDAVRAGAATWGSILEASGLPADQIEDDLVRRLH
ncbi:MAG: hypothetical protein P1P84_18160 [Deferrisomatales bacterium]|nr:hypothetical protein [Deferrisomatales bacterium]